MDVAVARLQEVNPDRIHRNLDNPRLVFPEHEMNRLLISIQEVGIKVPLTVYQETDHFVILDGERRWRCSRKLNLPAVPVIVQERPGPLENILTMFNIHNVRSDWDLMSIARKLSDVIKLLEADGKSTKPADVAGLTGLTTTTVNRALELLKLPERYQHMLLKEAEKPRDKQEVTADVFVELMKGRRVIERHVPEVFEHVTREQFVDAMVEKYIDGIETNLVDFRSISKIARAETTGTDRAIVAPTLVQLVRDREYRVKDAYHDTVEAAYTARDVSTRARGLVERLRKFRSARALPDETLETLAELRDQITRLLG